jgi:hypothetical protein
VKTTVWQGFLLGKPHRANLEEKTNHYELILEEVLDESFMVDLVKGTTSFAKAHPVLTGFMVNWAAKTLINYQRNKKNMIVYAPTPAERPKYFKMINDLKKTGWTVVKSRYMSGSGYEWELKQK